jgi:SRSO17 transposase
MGELGWDQYQGRQWPGFHRHAVTAMLAYRFLLLLELRQRYSHTRQGRPLDPFPASADVPAPDPAGCAL